MSIELKLLRKNGLVEDISTSSSSASNTDYIKVCGLPVLYLSGDTSPIAVSKDNKVTLSYVYGERSGTCTLKGQGATSYKTAQALVKAGKAGKFNYTIKFDNAFEAKSGWGAQNKYCLKANFIDTTHSRNIVSCILWGMSVKARSTVPTEMANLPNGGAIDGFPIIIMLNGEFHGLYTWNIPKDGWMFGLVEDTTKTQAIVGADDHTTATQFKEASMNGFEVEFVSDEDNAAWVETSLTRLISAVMNSDGSDLDTTVAQYLDWDSAIDHYIHTVVDKAFDCVDKNYLLVTFDGVRWYMSAYDRDSIHGLSWDASGLSRPVSNVSFIECAETVRIYELIKRFKTNALKARYKELRGNILSESRIMEKFENFAWAIPSPVMLEDVKLYPTIKGSGVNTIDQIGRFVRQRLVRCDEWINALPAQETPVEHAPDSLVTTSIGTDGKVFNGTGYKDGYRLSSSGDERELAASTVTGFIPYTDLSKTLTVSGVSMKSTDADGTYIGDAYVVLYNSDFEYVGHKNSSASGAGGIITGGSFTQDSNGAWEISLTGTNSGFAYVRISAIGNGANMVVTLNSGDDTGYTNLVSTSTDTDGSIYNGTGYKDNVRLSSRGGVSGTAQEGSVTTGFIPWTFPETVRIKGGTFMNNSSGHYYFYTYDSAKETIGNYGYFANDNDNSGFTEKTYYTGIATAAYDDATGVTTITFNPDVNDTRFNGAAYFRINAYGKGADLIVTVNQEIT